jgi:hypothetical protein
VNYDLVAVPDDLDEFQSFAGARGWSDGLPLVPPTATRVEAMLAGIDRPAGDELGPFPPNDGAATLELIAANAVMAGCRPDHFPFVVAAIEVILEPAYNIAGIQSTTNAATPFLVVNGPVGSADDFNGGGNALGQGARGNAAVGRAVRLAMVNIGGGVPRVRDMATLGQPGKYTLCLRENEEESPWEPYHVERGFAPDDTTVTAHSVTGTQTIFDGCSKTADELLKNFVSSTAYVGMHNMQMGGGPVITLCVDHARIFADAGYTKAGLKQLLFEQARMPVDKFPDDIFKYMVQRKRPRELWDDPPDGLIPLADSPETIKIFVAGGPGPHSMLMPRSSIGVRASITKQVHLPARDAVQNRPIAAVGVTEAVLHNGS